MEQKNNGKPACVNNHRYDLPEALVGLDQQED